MTKNEWRRPTVEEAKQGYIAMPRDAYYCQMDNGRLLEVAYSGTKQQARWTGYTVQKIERRIAWGGDLPHFITVKREERVAA